LTSTNPSEFLSQRPLRFVGRLPQRLHLGVPLLAIAQRTAIAALPRQAAASSPFAREAAFVSEVGHLSDADIARATGAAASTARAWLGLKRAPTGERAERLVELSALVERLTRVMDPSYIAVWLRKPVPALDDDSRSRSSPAVTTAGSPSSSPRSKSRPTTFG
jgi:hypothetical protein